MIWTCKNGERLTMKQMSYLHILNAVNCILDKRLSGPLILIKSLVQEALDRKLIAQNVFEEALKINKRVRTEIEEDAELDNLARNPNL